MAESVREFFESLESRADASRAAGLTSSYLFDVEGAGQWHVDVRDGRVRVTEGAKQADATIRTSEETFLKIMRREQNPATAFMARKIKVDGDMGAVMKLQKLF